MDINDFIKVRFALEDKKNGCVISSDDIGVVELFEQAISKISRYTSPDISETDKKSLEFQVGDIIRNSISNEEYEVVDTVVEYHSRGVNYSGLPSIVLRVYLRKR